MHWTKMYLHKWNKGDAAAEYEPSEYMGNGVHDIRTTATTTYITHRNKIFEFQWFSS